jgi:hypothetical protein
VTGEDVIPQEVQHRRDLDTLTRLAPFPAPHNISLPRAGGGPDRALHPELTGKSSPARTHRQCPSPATSDTQAFVPSHQVHSTRCDAWLLNNDLK